jgi:hypothetical protein
MRSNMNTQTTAKFEVGERVKINNPYCDSEWNVIGVVTEVEGSFHYPSYIVKPETGRFAGAEGGFAETLLEKLVDEPEPRYYERAGYRVGDRVTVTSSDFSTPVVKGATGVVTLASDTESPYVRVIIDNADGYTFPFRPAEITHYEPESLTQAVPALVAGDVDVSALPNGTVVRGIKAGDRYVRINNSWHGFVGLSTYNYAVGFAIQEEDLLVEYLPEF